MASPDINPNTASWSGDVYTLPYQVPITSAAKVYDLAVRLEAGMSRHPAHPPFSLTLMKKHGQDPYPDGITTTSELMTVGGHVGTHVDALGHIAYCGEIFGGRPIADAQSINGGLEIGSAEEIPPLIGRGHLFDGPALLGRDLTPADGIGPDLLKSWFADHEEPGRGSVVVLRTGWMKRWSDPDSYIGLKTGLPGLTRDGAEWLADLGVLAVGSDTMNLEHKIAGVVCLQVHVHLLVERGVFIMESMNLECLAAAGVTDFLFMAAPLRIKGGTGSPIRPLAIV